MLSNLALARGLNELLEILKADPQAIHTLSTNEKVSIVLFVAGLGMAVTFAVLIFLWFAISVLSSVLRNFGEEKKKPQPVKKVEPVVAVEETEEEDEELVAVIAAAVAASLNTSIHNIVVKNIVRVNDHSPSWAKTGRIEQMNTRF
jgi:sodium pump decarboxylase gamma subunit